MMSSSHTTSLLHDESWISNNTDVLAAWFGGTRPRLLPSIPMETSDSFDLGKVAFQASTNPQTLTCYDSEEKDLGVIGPFTGQNTNFDWLVTGASTYGGFSIPFHLRRGP
jgi:hypothetical protein